MKSVIFWGAVAVVAVALFARQDTAAASATPTLRAGALAAMPKTCATAALYVATDQPLGQQLEICSEGVWYPALSIGASGGLRLDDGVIDVNTAVVPRLQAMNDWTGRNTFQDVRLRSASTASCVDEANDVGRLALDTSDSANTRVKVCGVQGGKLQWLTTYLVAAYGHWDATE